MHTRLLVLSALALVLQGCVSYSPRTYETIRPAEYYADHEEYPDAYDVYAPDVYSRGVPISFADAAYYPWWSVDYFYMGPHYYRPGYWPGPRYSAGYRFGFPPGYWSYYGFFSPFYYPYASYAWYDPWTGFPRYGIGTNIYWQQIYWVNRNAHWSRARDRQAAGSDNDGSTYGNSLYENYDRYGDVFNDPRDRAPTAPISRGSLTTTPGVNTGSMQVRNRSDRKIRESRTGTTYKVGTPSVTRPASRPQTRPVVSTPQPAPAPRPGSDNKAPDYQPGRKRKN